MTGPGQRHEPNILQLVTLQDAVCEEGKLQEANIPDPLLFAFAQAGVATALEVALSSPTRYGQKQMQT
jgi:hypothetical protein